MDGGTEVPRVGAVRDPAVQLGQRALVEHFQQDDRERNRDDDDRGDCQSEARLEPLGWS